MSSTETGAIFGNIVYESTGYAERSVIVLNDIHIDIMDYISPASCPDVQFRSMWAEFEWENKVRKSAALISLVSTRPEVQLLSEESGHLDVCLGALLRSVYFLSSAAALECDRNHILSASEKVCTRIWCRCKRV